MRCVALKSAYPTETEARHALVTDLAPGVTLGRYLGLWRMPMTQAVVHLFTDAAPGWLRRSGWTPVVRQ
jgi:hypothetical protein